jgi:hypothetical protein
VFLKRKPLFYISGLGLALFGAVGLYGVHTDGLPNRFDADVLRYAEANDSDGNGKERALKCETSNIRGLEGEKICRFGANPDAPPQFLLWGDSHAAALQAAVAEEAKKNKVTGWSVMRSGCPALVGADRADNFVGYSCPAMGEAALEVIRRNHIKNVLLVTRWDMYALGWEKGSVETAREPFISFTTADGRRLLRGEAFAASFNETVKRLQALGVNIWVVKQVPPQLAYVSSALAKAQYLGRDVASLRRSYADIIARRRFVDQVFESAAKTTPLHFIDPADKFCPSKAACLISVDGQSLYTDNTHLTTYGALWSEDMLEPFFRALQ